MFFNLEIYREERLSFTCNIINRNSQQVSDCCGEIGGGVQRVVSREIAKTSYKIEIAVKGIFSIYHDCHTTLIVILYCYLTEEREQISYLYITLKPGANCKHNNC